MESRPWPPNPFTYDRPLEPVDVIDRQGEIDKLLELADAGQSVRLSAPRRYGKTTILRRVLLEVQDLGWAGVYVDLDRVVSLEGVAQRVEDAYRSQLQGPIRRVAVNLIRSLQPRLSAGARAARAEVAPTIEADARRLLERMLDLPVDIYKKAGKRTLVVFDEFQDLFRVGSEVEGLIRSRIQHQAREAPYIFAGSHPGLMLALFADRERPFFGQARPIILRPLDDASLGDFIEERFERTNRNPGEALEPLLALARGHPQRAMLLAHHLWEATPTDSKADLEAWRRAEENVDRELEEGFTRIWDRLGVNESRVLAAVSASGESLFHQRTLAHFGLKKSGAEKGRDKLLEFGELEDLGDGRLLVVDPLLERWVRRSQAPSQYQGFILGVSRLGIDPL